MESNLIIWFLNQLNIAIWEDTEVQNQWKFS